MEIHLLYLPKKCLIAKFDFWVPKETVCSLLWYLEHFIGYQGWFMYQRNNFCDPTLHPTAPTIRDFLCRIPELVYVPKKRFVCPYSVSWKIMWSSKFWHCDLCEHHEIVAWALVNEFLCRQSWSYDDVFCRRRKE